VLSINPLKVNSPIISSIPTNDRTCFQSGWIDLAHHIVPSGSLIYCYTLSPNQPLTSENQADALSTGGAKPVRFFLLSKRYAVRAILATKEDAI
jgi:hypothetical protein